jgi:hypothetical protein
MGISRWPPFSFERTGREKPPDEGAVRGLLGESTLQVGARLASSRASGQQQGRQLARCRRMPDLQRRRWLPCPPQVDFRGPAPGPAGQQEPQAVPLGARWLRCLPFPGFTIKTHELQVGCSPCSCRRVVRYCAGY